MTAIPLIYPKIPGSKGAPPGRCIAFEKYDGTNLHWDWDPEYGWTSFGTRRDSFALDSRGIAEFSTAHPGLEESPQIFRQEHADVWDKHIGGSEKYASHPIIVFTEFFGLQSFAGMHRKTDPKQLVIFDVEVAGVMVDPETFVRDFSTLGIARAVYHGKLTGKFAEDVRRGKYYVAEGVVCKGGSGDDRWMAKIKTYAYMEKLKQAFQDQWEEYWE